MANSIDMSSGGKGYRPIRMVEEDYIYSSGEDLADYFGSVIYRRQMYLMDKLADKASEVLMVRLAMTTGKPIDLYSLLSFGQLLSQGKGAQEKKQVYHLYEYPSL